MGKRIDCNKKQFWCWSKRCKQARSCACQVCSELKAINPNLYDACIDECQDAPRPSSTDTYLCDNIGADILFNRYGVIKCGFNPYETLEGQLYTEQEAQKEENRTFQNQIIIGLGIVVFLLLLKLIFD